MKILFNKLCMIHYYIYIYCIYSKYTYIPYGSQYPDYMLF